MGTDLFGVAAPTRTFQSWTDYIVSCRKDVMHSHLDRTSRPRRNLQRAALGVLLVFVWAFTLSSGCGDDSTVVGETAVTTVAVADAGGDERSGDTGPANPQADVAADMGPGTGLADHVTTEPGSMRDVGLEASPSGDSGSDYCSTITCGTDNVICFMLGCEACGNTGHCQI
jgi:hypothetical protein